MNDSLMQRFTDLFRAPSRLMDNVAEAPRLVAPLLVIMVIMTGFTWLTAPIAGPEQMEVMRDSRLMRMVPEEAWQEQYEQAMHPTPAKRALQAVTSGFTTLISIVVFGWIMAFFVRMGGNDLTLRQGLGVVAWASLIPFGLATLVKLPLILMTESVFSVTIGLAAFLPDAGPHSALFQILMAYGDFFTWWGLVLLVIGFARTARVPAGMVIVPVVMVWAVLTAIPVGIGLVMM